MDHINDTRGPDRTAANHLNEGWAREATELYGNILGQLAIVYGIPEAPVTFEEAWDLYYDQPPPNLYTFVEMCEHLFHEHHSDLNTQLMNLAELRRMEQSGMSSISGEPLAKVVAEKEAWVEELRQNPHLADWRNRRDALRALLLMWLYNPARKLCLWSEMLAEERELIRDGLRIWDFLTKGQRETAAERWTIKDEYWRRKDAGEEKDRIFEDLRNRYNKSSSTLDKIVYPRDPR